MWIRFRIVNQVLRIHKDVRCCCILHPTKISDLASRIMHMSNILDAAVYLRDRRERRVARILLRTTQTNLSAVGCCIPTCDYTAVAALVVEEVG